MRYLVMFLSQALGLKFNFNIFVFDIADLNDTLLGKFHYFRYAKVEYRWQGRAFLLTGWQTILSPLRSGEC